ncbi:MAG: discoidin domain-containing protein [Armatimonadetes bacterium]|nr:discoidin domain-containing protein [Armatimonadota bacterium]
MASVKPLGEAGPEAVIDGLKWPMANGFHQWRSDPREGLPQWLAVEFAQAVAVNTVYLTFDTNIYGRFPTAQPGAEATARDYRVLAQVAGEWREVVRAAGNWQRFRRHRFPEVTATALKLEITAATPRAEARVYELRAYRE